MPCTCIYKLTTHTVPFSQLHSLSEMVVAVVVLGERFAGKGGEEVGVELATVVGNGGLQSIPLTH